MNLQKLFDVQKELNRCITNKNDEEPSNLFKDKILKFIIKISELANEIQPYKYRDQISCSLQKAYIVGFHDLLSLGLNQGAHTGFLFFKYKIVTKGNRDHFLDIYANIMNLNDQPSIINFIELFTSYIQLGQLLHFEPNEIEKVYLDTYVPK
ncbi:TPA: dUTP diphosphatase [Bacillus thuringiensis]|nr:dUTP diphosphatase [Bacillus thuringiensis]